MRDAVILDATRTPWGKFGGALKDYPAAELAGLTIRALLQRNPQLAPRVESVILGQVLQGGAGQMPARQALVAGGLPFETPALLVNKVCASGMRAVSLAATLIRAGEHDLVLAGGMESMSNAPYYDFSTRWGARMGNRSLVDGMVMDGLWCAFDDCHMANQGDDLAAQREVSRLDMDEWSVLSQQRWGDAYAAGYFDREITPVPNRRDPSHTALARDESPRPNSTVERLGRIPPVYNTRAITAGNAPGVNDGAAALAVATSALARDTGIEPLAQVVAHAEVAMQPREFPVASAFAIKKLLAATGLTLDDIDVIEVNEAFAAVPLICGQELAWDTSRVNRRGGSVAMGHPIGASGARLVMTTAYQLQELGRGYGIAAICSGSGQGDAILLKR